MKYFEVKNETATCADIYIYGDIADDAWESDDWYDNSVYPRHVRFALDRLKDKELHVHINSGGGHVFAGTAIANMIRQHPRRTTAIIDGLAGSIASVIAFSCDSIEIPSNAYLMIHKPSCVAGGNEYDLQRAIEMLRSVQKGIVSTYANHTIASVSEDKIVEMVEAETWLTGAEAAEFFDVKVTPGLELVACSGEYFERLKNPKIKNQSIVDNSLMEKEIELALAIY